MLLKLIRRSLPVFALVGLLAGVSGSAAAEDEGSTDAETTAISAAAAPATLNSYDWGAIVCTAQNIRGARYDGYASGYDSYNRACNIALENCYRDTVLKRSCHVIGSHPTDGGGGYPPPPPLPPPPPSDGGRFCDRNWDTSDATACGAPDGNGRQWYCSPRNNWCVLP